MNENDYDFTIHNNGSIDELHHKLYSLTETNINNIIGEMYV